MNNNSKFSLDTGNILGASNFFFISVLNSTDPDWEKNFDFSDSPYDNYPVSLAILR